MSLAYHARYLCPECDKYHKPGSKQFNRCEAIRNLKLRLQELADKTGMVATGRIGSLTIKRNPKVTP